MIALGRRSGPRRAGVEVEQPGRVVAVGRAGAVGRLWRRAAAAAESLRGEHASAGAGGRPHESGAAHPRRGPAAAGGGAAGLWCRWPGWLCRGGGSGCRSSSRRSVCRTGGVREACGADDTPPRFTPALAAPGGCVRSARCCRRTQRSGCVGVRSYRWRARGRRRDRSIYRSRAEQVSSAAGVAERAISRGEVCPAVADQGMYRSVERLAR
jgi:hypothetical protein